MKTVLIVDDDSNMRNALRRVLEHPELNFVEAANGLAAFEKIINSNIDIILLDYKMPYVDGLEFLQWIDKSYLEIEIILMSGYMEKLLLENLMPYKKRLLNILVKPCDEERIRRAVWNLI